MISRPTPFTWSTDGLKVVCREDDQVSFSDSDDHWRNGFCRLLALDDLSARRLIETVLMAAHEQSGKTWSQCTAWEQVDALGCGTRSFYGMKDDAPSLVATSEGLAIGGEPIDRIWLPAVQQDRSLAVAGSQKLAHGILVRTDGHTYTRVDPARYEALYFEGEAVGYGYGSYSAQAGWRLEKSRRQVRQIRGLIEYFGGSAQSGLRLLDVGSGYGYFRQAAQEAGWNHDGIELSHHAVQEARTHFGFSTFVGSVIEFQSQAKTSYDVITVFDTLEHVVDPHDFLLDVVGLLANDGYCVIRTPNLLALEADVFGRYYHSLKREHLHYFSAQSLCYFFQSVGLMPRFVTTEAHLLQGLLGDQLGSFERLLRGSDLFAIAQKRGTKET